ncbi:MAG: ankyrin repeat domain-containing protein [Planctomycetes bacterium]|nr:ankyrin repeat domain-containing protein [Planctomycetota bacterium]
MNLSLTAWDMGKWVACEVVLATGNLGLRFPETSSVAWLLILLLMALSTGLAHTIHLLLVSSRTRKRVWISAGKCILGLFAFTALQVGISHTSLGLDGELLRTIGWLLFYIVGVCTSTIWLLRHAGTDSQVHVSWFRLAASHILTLTLLIGVVVSPKTSHEWHRALNLAVKNDLFAELVIFIVPFGYDIEAGDENGITALHAAAQHGKPQIARWLVSRGVDINSKDQQSNTPLHLAVLAGDEEMVSYLLSVGANVSALNGERAAPLHLAASMGHDKLIPLLLKAGADVNATDGLYRSVVAVANNETTIRALVAAGCPVNRLKNQRASPLVEAVKAQNMAKIRLLVSMGADVNGIDGVHQETPLCRAAQLGRTDLLDVLAELGADPNLPVNNWSPLHLATKRDVNYSVLDWLIAHGANVNHPGYRGSTPLHEAAKHDMVQVARFLISHGANVNALDDQGRTPFFTAVHFDRQKEMLGLLLGAGSSTELLDAAGVHAVRPSPINDKYKSYVEKLIALHKADTRIEPSSDQNEGNKKTNESSRR